MSEVAGEMMKPVEVVVSQVSRSRRPGAMLSGGGRAVPNLP